MDEIKKLTSEELQELIEKKDIPGLRHLFDIYEEVDIADCVEHLEKIEDVILIFKYVNSEYTAELFSFLSKDMQEKLITAMSDKDVLNLINESANDDIADFVADMPANLVAKVLKNCPKETRADVNVLLNYKDNTAGSLMTTEFISIISTTKVSDAIKLIREEGKDAETVYTIFVRDEKRNFLGTADLDDLIFSSQDETLFNIMNKNVVTVKVDTDQEDVANQFKRYDVNAMAVLNEEDKLVGIITVDDVLDVIDKEATEDIALQAGISPLNDTYLNTSVFRMAFKCLPWIMVLLVLGMFSSMVLSTFQDAISVVPCLAAFIPVLMDTGGNAGQQTSTVMVRCLALDEFKKGDGWHIIWKEARIALIVAACISLFSFCWFLFELSIGIVKYDPSTTNMYEVAGLVSITLFFTVVLSKVVGCTLPLIAKALHKDPALMSSPFVTTIVDVCSLLIYFFICSYIFKMV